MSVYYKGDSKMGKKEKGSEMLLVGSKTKEALKSSGLNVSGEALFALNERVHELVQRAQARCQGNKRKTVKATDF